MSENKKEKNQKQEKENCSQPVNAMMNRSANHVENQNQNHNTKKEALGPNTKR
ncbi:hypothetical protein [Hydrogenoanaerobacterium sp.]|uniref:hypothetical protein n=1 Tax=Hydrogenoanaerobacterium sp. TaxID=2953763 RepID=UPI00289888A1|nr:hypothetical protein [Hydrogenoanaerobacterium sp.]